MLIRKLKSSGITSLRATASPLVRCSNCGGMIRTARRIAGINRGTARQQGMRESRTAVIFHPSKLWVGFWKVAGRIQAACSVTINVVALDRITSLQFPPKGLLATMLFAIVTVPSPHSLDQHVMGNPPNVQPRQRASHLPEISDSK